MKYGALCLCVTVLVVCTCGCSERSRVASAVGELRKKDKSVQWDANTAVVADVTCDGKPDTVILGYSKARGVGCYRFRREQEAHNHDIPNRKAHAGQLLREAYKD